MRYQVFNGPEAVLDAYAEDAEPKMDNCMLRIAEPEIEAETGASTD